MRIDIKRAIEIMKEKDCFVILSHMNPDGDTLGSAFALCRALRLMGKKARCICEDEIAKKYSYLFEDMEEQSFEEKYVISVDVADSLLLGDTLEKKYKNKIGLAIDHHGSNKIECDNLLLDENAAACCEIIFLCIKEMGLEIDSHIADCLFTGITTDTGCFRYYNATSRTFEMASELIKLGAKSGKINEIMFETVTKTYVNLERLVMNGLEMYFSNRCALAYVTQEMYRISGSDESEIDPLASKTRQIEGVDIGVLLKERKDGSFKVSLRTSDPINASDICAKLGGGGHIRASGCQLAGPLENAKKEMLNAIEEYLHDGNYLS